MKRMTATVLFLAALSTPALAETPTDREMHSWDYVQTVAYPPAPAEAPVIEHHEQRPYHAHHDMEKGKHHHGKHAMKKHEGKKAAHHHHHHKMTKKDSSSTTTTTTTTTQPK